MINDLQVLILNWYKKVERPLPWRKNPEPYPVWLSEIILQQTRVDQGMRYYLDFISAYPKIQDLASAEESEVLKRWQGLGYYSRARNLLKTAKLVTQEYNGVFPKTANELLKLPGVGPYTAAAIASICYNEPVPVIDGNVYRVLSRIFDVDAEIPSAKANQIFPELAKELLVNKKSGTFNQAMMEFGALQCVPKNPNCETCPVSPHCLARQNKTVALRPVKRKAKAKTKRYFLFWMTECMGETLVEKRGEDGIWRNMYQWPLVELNEMEFKTQAVPPPSFLNSDKIKSIDILPVERKHLLSHQEIHARIARIALHEKPSNLRPEFFWVNREDFTTFALPKLIVNLYQDCLKIKAV